MQKFSWGEGVDEGNVRVAGFGVGVGEIPVGSVTN